MHDVCRNEMYWVHLCGVREQSPQKIFASHTFQTVGKSRKHLLSIYAFLILAREGFQIVVQQCTTLLFCQQHAISFQESTSHGIGRDRYAKTRGVFRVPMYFSGPHRTYLGLPTWNSAWVPLLVTLIAKWLK